MTSESIFDHVAFHVEPSKFDDTVAWYLAALAPLGITKQIEIPGRAVGLGVTAPSPRAASFWIGAKEGANITGLHLAFKAKDHETVDKFHAEALKAGGTCNGKPGLRDYHPNYYGAFVLDPAG